MEVREQRAERDAMLAKDQEKKKIEQSYLDPEVPDRPAQKQECEQDQHAGIRRERIAIFYERAAAFAVLRAEVGGDTRGRRKSQLQESRRKHLLLKRVVQVISQRELPPELTPFRTLVGSADSFGRIRVRAPFPGDKLEVGIAVMIDHHALDGVAECGRNGEPPDGG